MTVRHRPLPQKVSHATISATVALASWRCLKRAKSLFTVALASKFLKDEEDVGE